MPSEDRGGGQADRDWAAAWLEGVADGTSTMSQRKLDTIEKHGGLDVAREVAREMGVHLLLLEDDKGVRLVAASTKPFEVIC